MAVFGQLDSSVFVGCILYVSMESGIEIATTETENYSTNIWGGIFAVGKAARDTTCGTGYGIVILAEKARKIISQK